ncbi:MAG TPA: phosphatase PAP2 family protein [Thermoleophilaceae bacterium]
MERSTRTLLGLAAACAVGFLLVTLCAFELADGPWLDRVGLEGFLAMQTTSLHDVTRAAARLGDPAQVGLIGLVLAAVAVARGRPRVALVIIALLALTSISSQLLKDLLAHPRLNPVIDGGHVGAASLPSGHSTAAMALALAAVFAAPRRARPAAAVIGAAVALAVGFSVVSLGWHFPSDVLAGYLLATGWALVLAAGLRELDSRRPARRRAGGPAAFSSLVDRVSADGLTVAAAALAGIGLIVALLFAATHAPEIADFGRVHTTSVAIVAGMALAALALPAGMAAALRRA